MCSTRLSQTVDHAWSGQFCTDSSIGEALPGNFYAGTSHALSDHKIFTATLELPVSSPWSSLSPALVVVAFRNAPVDFQSSMLDGRSWTAAVQSRSFLNKRGLIFQLHQLPSLFDCGCKLWCPVRRDRTAVDTTTTLLVSGLMAVCVRKI